jgi:tRNA nucleotidyltransferase/poly(A) polymerase
MTSDAVFADDPVRILRGFRFCAQLGFTLDPATQQRLQEQALDLAEKMHRGNDSH